MSVRPTFAAPCACPPPGGSARARTVLFVPATRLDRVDKALASGADHVVVDLEDAVEPDAKAAARAALGEFLAEQPHGSLLVRINAAGTPWHADDLALCAARPAVSGVMLPKAEAGEPIRRAAAAAPIWAIVETARGLLGLAELVATPGLERLMLGTLDLGVDLGLTPGSEGAGRLLDQARFLVLLQSRAAGLAPPIDGVHPQVDDEPGLRRHARAACEMGFGGVGCIHPAQVPVVHEAFQPAPAEVDWACRVLAEAQRTGQGVFRLDGAMVDAPVIARARVILARAEA